MPVNINIDHFFKDGYWTKTTRKQFFDEFAKDLQFDPLFAENWYNMDKPLLRARRVSLFSFLIPFSLLGFGLILK